MAPSGTIPSGVAPATALKSDEEVEEARRCATARPMVTTSLAIAEAVRRWRKISRSRSSPSSGASTTTDTRTAGTSGHSHSTLALKNIAAETYACAPNARLNTPDVL